MNYKIMFTFFNISAESINTTKIKSKSLKRILNIFNKIIFSSAKTKKYSNLLLWQKNNYHKLNILLIIKSKWEKNIFFSIFFLTVLHPKKYKIINFKLLENRSQNKVHIFFFKYN